MKSVRVKQTMAVVILGLVLTATPVLANHLLELKIMGSGTWETNCLTTLEPGCTVTSSGVAQGTFISTDTADGSFFFRIDTGSPALANNTVATAPPGVCLPANFVGSLTAVGGDILNFVHTGLACEETRPGSPVHYTGTFRIYGGTGVFSTANGGGSVTATFANGGQGGTAFLHLHGTIRY